MMTQKFFYQSYLETFTRNIKILYSLFYASSTKYPMTICNKICGKSIARDAGFEAMQATLCM